MKKSTKNPKKPDNYLIEEDCLSLSKSDKIFLKVYLITFAILVVLLLIVIALLMAIKYFFIFRY